MKDIEVNTVEIERGAFGSNLVSQHNNLIVACYDLTVTEKKLLLGCICKINSFEHITSETAFRFDVKEAGDIIGVDLSNSGAVDRFRKAARGLMTKLVTNDTVDGWVDSTFAQTAEYDATEQIMTIYFSKGMIPYLSDLHNQFTTYRIMHIGQLDSKHAIRLYELLVMWHGQNYKKSEDGYKKFELNDFIKIMGSSDTYKSSVGMFKQRVVKPAVDKINKATDINVKVNFLKTSKKITHIELEFSVNKAWIEAEKSFKKVLSEKQVNKIVNCPAFFNKYYEASGSSNVALFLSEAMEKLRENPKKYYPDYKNYFKGEIVNKD